MMNYHRLVYLIAVLIGFFTYQTRKPGVWHVGQGECAFAGFKAQELRISDPEVHVIVLSGNGLVFSAGYDLAYYAEGNSQNQVVQDMPCDPIKYYAFMWRNTQHFMSL